MHTILSESILADRKTSSMDATVKRYSYRATPQVSASQIAEYLGASATRRKSIICAARFPKKSIVAQYDMARKGLVKFLNDGTRSYRHLGDAKEYLGRRLERPEATNWLKRDSRSSMEAIDAFLGSYNTLGLQKLDCREVTGRQPLLSEWPTKVSVGLDLTAHRPSKEGKDKVGGLIFLFSRGEKKSKARIERSKTIAGLIYTFCNAFLAEQYEVDRSLCLAIDVFERKAYQPPGEFLRALDQIADACDEIASRWRSVPPPDDYDGPPYD